MFRDEAQRNRVCLAVLGPELRRRDLWGPEGPTDLGVQYAERGGGPLSTGERTLFAVAFAVWNGQGQWASISDVVSRLDDDNTARVGTMLIALAAGAQAVDQWLERQEGGSPQSIEA